jgi:hypothetical protein
LRKEERLLETNADDLDSAADGESQEINGSNIDVVDEMYDNINSFD